MVILNGFTTQHPRQGRKFPRNYLGDREKWGLTSSFKKVKVLKLNTVWAPNNKDKCITITAEPFSAYVNNPKLVPCCWSLYCHSEKRSTNMFGYKSEEFQKPQPLLVSKKVRQYTSNLYCSTPPICIAGPSWLLTLKERETQQYTSHLYCSTPPIWTAVRLPFVRQYF